MEQLTNNEQPQSVDREFQKYAWIRIVAGIIVAAIFLFGVSFFIDFISPPEADTPALSIHEEKSEPAQPNDQSDEPSEDIASALPETRNEEADQPGESNEATSQQQPQIPASVRAPKVEGVEFIEALIKPLDYELNKRTWGWRPNDIIQFTDNVNEFQLGVLEVTRRAVTRLTENISRTGSNATLNPYLEQAMNGLMMNSDRYFFPSAEGQYNDSLQKLRWYKDQLELKEAFFYNRPDNLIPLLNAFEELLGSCDENLVKIKEENGDKVSTFSADNYYYYAKGVANSMAIILEAVETDFGKTLDMRNGKEVLHRAIESCHHASQLDPWLFVTEANLCGIFANHRANMAAQISHARFYVGLLGKALST